MDERNFDGSGVEESSAESTSLELELGSNGVVAGSSDEGATGEVSTTLGEDGPGGTTIKEALVSAK